MSEEINEFENIGPYSDEEAVKALAIVADHPAVAQASKFIFPDQPETFLRDMLKKIQSVDDFQRVVMSKAVEWVIENSVKKFTYDGLENLPSDRKYLALSNHRDIILDPAFTQYILLSNGLPLTQIAVGDNLLKNKYVEYLIRSNRMIKVIRGISARSLYLSSQVLSKYIRNCITSGESSIWLAQREGRTKNGIDITEQGLLKMLDMSGAKEFVDNFEELNIIPLSISYEYEPCDILKAREIMISRTQKYEKQPNEDIISIVTGIKEYKGNVHLHIGEPLTHQEILDASFCNKNDRYQFIRHAVDIRVIEGYKLWKTNYMAFDIQEGEGIYASEYTPEEMTAFKAYIEGRLALPEPELDRNELRQTLLDIYANPVRSKINREASEV
ncbi:MAG: 1-acyl-sn-glycerol-3-phosphate acyltransferase [Bacteroidales bacterium]|nr:1-acyl-sn-glycerol-3-phosphate acyltransferase [Bacteroidales bacterium]